MTDVLDADEVRLVVHGRQAWMSAPGHSAAWIRATEEAAQSLEEKR